MYREVEHRKNVNSHKIAKWTRENYKWKCFVILCITMAVSESKFGPPVNTIWAVTWQNQQNECAPNEDQISLDIRPVWSESSLSA